MLTYYKNILTNLINKIMAKTVNKNRKKSSLKNVIEKGYQMTIFDTNPNNVKRDEYLHLIDVQFEQLELQ